MAALTLRLSKGTPLTNAELDANFSSLNSELSGKQDSLGFSPLNKAGDTVTGNINFLDTLFTLQDEVDPTKQARFQLSGLTASTTRTYTLPNIDGVLATLGNPGLQTFSGSLTLGGFTTAHGIGTNQTSGTTTIGGTTQTGTLTFGRSTATQTTDIQAGATASGNTKTINFGTAGLSGSTTAIAIGSAVSGATTNVTANGTWTFASPISGSVTGSAATITGVYGGTLTSGQVTTALGFTPYDATNPSGFITSSALTPYLTSAIAAATYQPLLGYTAANKAGDTFTGSVLTTNAGGFTANSAAKLWTDSGRGRIDLYEGSAQTKSLRVMNANGYGIVGMVSAENLELWTNGNARLTIGGTGSITASTNVLVNNGNDSRFLVQVSGVTEGQLQATSALVRLASNNLLPLSLSTNGVDRVTLASDGGVTFGTSAYVGMGGAPSTSARLRVLGSGASSEVARIEGGTLGALLIVNQTDAPGVNNLRPELSLRKNNVIGGQISVDVDATSRGIVYYDASGLTGQHAFYINSSEALRLNVYGGLSFAGAGYGTSGQFLKSGGATAAAAWGALTSGEVTGALGFTPYNATNPSGYITASASITGNAATATALQTARTIGLTGDVSGSASFDGTANVSINATVADDSHNHVISNVDGLQAALDARAPLTSPTFTGPVTAPSLITDKYVNSTGRVLTYDFSANSSTAVGDLDGYFDSGEALEVFSFAATGDSQNYYVEGTIKIQAGALVETLFIRAAVRSDARPQYSWSGQYERYSEANYLSCTPVFWVNETTGTGEIRLVLKFVASNIHDIECSFKVFQRGAYGEALTVTTNHVSNSVPANFVEHALSKRIELTAAGLASSAFVGDLAGNAATATTLATGRTITLTGDVTYTSGSFNGSANVTGTATLANSGVTAGTYTKLTVDAKGRATAGASLTASDIPTLTMANLPGAAYKQSVRAATTANLTATATTTTLTNSSTLAALTLDGITLATNDRVLVKNQTTAAQNGIYTVTNTGSASVAWVLTRTADASGADEIGAAVVNIDQGTANGGELWTTTFKTTDTLGTTAMNWYEVLYNTGTWGISITGSAGTLTTSRTLTLGATGKTFDGSANVSWTRTEIIGNPPLSGAWWSGNPPVVGTDGVLEVGRYIDFHSSNAGTTDFDARIECTGTNAFSFGGATVSATTFSGALSGNATTATTLATVRTINGTSFNGSANILTASWGTARTLTIGSTGKSVDGSAAVSWTLAEIGALSLVGGTTSGNIGIRTTSPTVTFQDTDSNSAFLHCNANLFYILRGATDSTGWTQVGGYWPAYWDLTNNNATFGGSLWCAGNVTAYSDEKLKANWEDLAPDFIERLAQVKHGTFDRIDIEERQVGVSAQSLQPVLPEAVGYHEKEDVLSVNYGNAALVAAVALAKRVVALEARLAALEGDAR